MEFKMESQIYLLLSIFTILTLVPISISETNSRLDQQILELKPKVLNILPEGHYFQTDVYLSKWIVANKYDVEKAEIMLREALAWKKDNKLGPGVLKEYLSEIILNFHTKSQAMTNPVIQTLDFGKWDIRSAVENGEEEKFRRYYYQMFETLDDIARIHAEESNGTVSQFTIIDDMGGLALRTVTHYKAMSVLKSVLDISQKYYPELIRHLYVINAPRIFQIFYTFLKPVLTPSTRSKLEIFSKKSRWQFEILNKISSDQLTPQYGGTKGQVF